MVEEQDALEVVHLVLDARRHHAFQRLGMLVPVEVLPADRAGRRAIDVGVDIGDREAPFLIGRKLFRRIEDFGESL